MPFRFRRFITDHGIVQWVIWVLLGWCMTVGVAHAEPYYLRDIWLDTTRQRHVNVRISYAAPRREASDAAPILLFSSPQGWRWGGHQDHYEYLAEEMADRGVVMVTIGHYHLEETEGTHESFADIYPGILTGVRNDIAIDRYEDVRFVLRELERINAEKRPNWPAYDTAKLIVGGHSSGTLTALSLCGLPVRDAQGQIYVQSHDPRVAAFVLFGYPLAYSGPSRRDLNRIGSVPGLHVVGSQDHPTYRHASFRHIQNAPQYWVVAHGGHSLGAIGSEDLVRQVMGTFVSAYVLRDQQALSRLRVETYSGHRDLAQFRRRMAAGWIWDQRDAVDWLRSHLPWGKWLHDRSIAYHRAQGSELTP